VSGVADPPRKCGAAASGSKVQWVSAGRTAPSCSPAQLQSAFPSSYSMRQQRAPAEDDSPAAKPVSALTSWRGQGLGESAGDDREHGQSSQRHGCCRRPTPVVCRSNWAGGVAAAPRRLMRLSLVTQTARRKPHRAGLQARSTAWPRKRIRRCATGSAASPCAGTAREASGEGRPPRLHAHRPARAKATPYLASRSGRPTWSVHDYFGN
jgi:hypothetical protein